MMNEIFKTLLIMSLAGGVLTIFLLIAKPLTTKLFGYKWQYYIWHAVLWTLVLPVRVSTKFALPESIGSKIQSIAETPVYKRMVIGDLNGVYHAQNLAGAPDVPDFNVFSALAFCWLAVAVFLVIRTVFNYIGFKNAIKENSALLTCVDGVTVKESVVIHSPILIGVTKPVLYIPQGENNIEKILLHEKVHIKRNDLIYKWIVTLLKCVHWFNPLVWVMARQFDEACEVSCDVQATALMSKSEKREYMLVLVELSQKALERKTALALGLSSGGKTLKRRLVAIEKSKVKPGVVTILGVAIAMTLTFASVYAGGMLQGGINLHQKVEEYVLVLPKAEEKAEKQEALLEYEIETKPEPAEAKEVKTEEPTVEIPEVAKADIIRGEFGSAGGNTRNVYGVKANSEGHINVEIHSSAQEVVDIYVQNEETGRDVFSFSIPVPYNAAYSIDGLEPGKSYNIVLKGEMRDNWNIDGEYIIY